MGVLWAISAIVITLALAQGPAGGIGGALSAQSKGANAEADITLKTRVTVTFRGSSGMQSRVRTEAVYISGKRERRDISWEGGADVPAYGHSSIVDCDGHQLITLQHTARTYNVQPFPDLAAQQATRERLAKARKDIEAGRVKLTPAATNAAVTTIETTDTGERREQSGLTLRLLRQGETTSGGAAASSGHDFLSRSEVREGWYVELPAVQRCGETSAGESGFATFAVLRSGLDVPPRVEFKGNVPPRLGTPVEATSTTEYGDGNASVEKTELVDLSRGPVDPKLFEIPAGYREALHTPHGGRDMMQPDTMLNRAWAWWQELRREWSL